MQSTFTFDELSLSLGTHPADGSERGHASLTPSSGPNRPGLMLMWPLVFPCQWLTHVCVCGTGLEQGPGLGCPEPPTGDTPGSGPGLPRGPHRRRPGDVRQSQASCPLCSEEDVASQPGGGGAWPSAPGTLGPCALPDAAGVSFGILGNATCCRQDEKRCPLGRT